MGRPEGLVIEESGRMEVAAATRIADAVESSIRQRGHCAFALAGGKAPLPVYRCLAAAPLSERVTWERVAIYFGDERGVPPDHPESNFLMAKETLLDRVPILRAQIHRMEGERPDREASAQDYERLLPGRLDVLLLGMGRDGHTASLFPNSWPIREQFRRSCRPRVPTRPPSGSRTPPVIRDARKSE